MEVPKHLGAFLSRDIVYSMSGVAVEVCLLYKFDRLQNLEFSLAPILFISTVGWVIGSSLQFIASIIGLVTTGWIRKPNRIDRCLYLRATGEKWKAHNCDLGEATRALRAAMKSQYRRAHYERLATHVIAGACLAPSAFLSSVLLIWNAMMSREPFDITIASGVLLLAIVLTTWNRVKAMEMTQKDWSILAEQRPEAGATVEVV